MLSKLLENYDQSLKNQPLLTKSLTSGIIGFAGALVSSKIQKNEGSLWSKTGPLTIYGLAFAGPITHYFYNILESLSRDSKKKVLIERFLFCPLLLVMTLYILERLQGRNHAETWQKLKKIYVSALIANWKIWTIPQLINLNFVPVQFRVLFANFVAFFWNIYLAKKTSNIKSE